MFQFVYQEFWDFSVVLILIFIFIFVDVIAAVIVFMVFFTLKTFNPEMNSLLKFISHLSRSCS